MRELVFLLLVMGAEMEGEEAVLMKTKSRLFPENGQRSELKCLVL